MWLKRAVFTFEKWNEMNEKIPGLLSIFSYHSCNVSCDFDDDDAGSWRVLLYVSGNDVMSSLCRYELLNCWGCVEREFLTAFAHDTHLKFFLFKVIIIISHTQYDDFENEKWTMKHETALSRVSHLQSKEKFQNFLYKR